MASDKRSPAQVLADRRSSGVSVRSAGGAFSAPIKQVDAKTREAIERFEKTKGRGR